MMQLDDWLARHGPMWPPVALAMVLDACVTASQMDRRTLGAVIGSLNPAGIVRRPDGWAWVPARTSSDGRRMADGDIVERLGATLFAALSGETQVDLLANEAAWRSAIRASRPELSTGIVDLTLEALSARRHGVTLAGFAREIRQALGIERQSTLQLRRLVLAAGGIAAVVLISAALWSRTLSEDRTGTDGLTKQESIRQDITYEFATTDALIDEHTAAIALYTQWGQVWQARLGPDDPRLKWAIAHQAWVRTLMGDSLTAEQLLSDAPVWLARELGSRHPYTRSARLALAATLDVRGRPAEAASLRNDADIGVRELFAEGGRLPDLLAGIPAPPGVLAHVSPNVPEREGFRRGPAGEFIAPLTSVQRLIAGRNGWRLHIVAEGPCRTSVVVGNVPRRVTVNAVRGADDRWQIQLLGTNPALTADAGSADTARVSLVGDGRGHVRLDADGRTWPMALDDGATPDPPYALTLEGANPQDRGCAVVWLEIAFPHQPGAKLSTAVSP